MKRIAIADDGESTSPSNGSKTLVLVGRTGNGKSATGNTILGRKAFKSKASSSGITSSCESQRTVLQDGQIVNVIDTPGLFDISAGIDFVCKEIAKCIDLAKDGIHAVLLVLSVIAPFSEEEAATLRSLRTLFGSKIYNYMIVVFTGGDELDDNDETLDDYLGHECPQPLKDTLILCENRRVLFDNKTKDETKRIEQVQHLLSLVNMVMVQNDGKPYTELVGSLERYTKGELMKSEEQMHKSYEAQLYRISEMVQANLRETITRMEQKLAEEQVARTRAEQLVQFAQKKSKDEVRLMRESLEKAQREIEELRKRTKIPCALL